jgi:protein-L-isoaspartate(D-aspartate) O-methyltransferase
MTETIEPKETDVVLEIGTGSGDQLRKEIDTQAIGPWIRESDWKLVGTTVPVPEKAREAIVRIGLNGATGRLDIDDIRFRPKPR